MATFGFDSIRFYNDLVEYLVSLVDGLTQDFYKEAVNNMMIASAKEEVKVEPAKLEGSTPYSGGSKAGYEFINSRIWFYTMAVLDSYGTGVEMDMSNLYLNNYMHGQLWNPARKGREIVGRPKGKYTNIFGDTAESSGKYEGIPVPIASYNIPASRAIQKMEDWIMKDGETRIEREIKKFADQFIAENAHKYFRSGD